MSPIAAGRGDAHTDTEKDTVSGTEYLVAWQMPPARRPDHKCGPDRGCLESRPNNRSRPALCRPAPWRHSLPQTPSAARQVWARSTDRCTARIRPVGSGLPVGNIADDDAGTYAIARRVESLIEIHGYDLCQLPVDGERRRVLHRPAT